MEAVRVALIQLSWSGSRETMKQQVLAMTAQAAADAATLVCLPELSLSPYFPGSRDSSGFDWAEDLPGGDSEQFFSTLAHEHKVIVCGSLFEKTPDGHFYDTATIHNAAGQLVSCTRKIHIPSGEGYHETDFFEGGDSYPVADLGSIKMATPTCYDQWFPELSRLYTLNGAEFIFYPTTIGSEPTDPLIDSAEAWQTVMRGQAIANGVYIGAANRIGQENGVTFYGSSFICDPTGKILAQAGRDTTEIIFADLDPYVLNHWHTLFPLLKQRKPQTYRQLSD
ncbi:MAG: hydrolase [Chitinophagaceae bacterium]|nr:hydrolase [Anaerolineae bacterium]